MPNQPPPVAAPDPLARYTPQEIAAAIEAAGRIVATFSDGLSFGEKLGVQLHLAAACGLMVPVILRASRSQVLPEDMQTMDKLAASIPKKSRRSAVFRTLADLMELAARKLP